MSANNLNKVEETLEKEIANLRQQKEKAYTNASSEMDMIDEALNNFWQLQNKLQVLKRSEQSEQQIAQLVENQIQRLYKNKNKTKVNQYLEPFIEKATLLTKRNKRINKAFPLKVRNEYTKRKRNWTTTVAPEIQKLEAELAQLIPTMQAKSKRKNELHKNLLKLQLRGHLVNEQNPYHPLQIQLNTKQKTLQTYRNKKQKNKQDKNINEYKAKFNKYGYTYVPAFKGTRGEGMRASNQTYSGGIAEHFIYQTKIDTTENAPIPAGWKKISEEKTEYNKGQFASTYYKYSFVRDLPSGYPSGKLFRNQWDSALATLEASSST